MVSDGRKTERDSTRDGLIFWRYQSPQLSSAFEESETANLDHVRLDNQSALTLQLDTIGIVLFTDTIEMNEKFRKLNPTRREIDSSYKTAISRCKL